jgi:Dyp-type peroxidase family
MQFLLRPSWSDPDVRDHSAEFAAIQGYGLLGHDKGATRIALLRYHEDSLPEARLRLATYGRNATDALRLYQSYAEHQTPGSYPGVTPVECVRSVGISSPGLRVYPESARPKGISFEAGFAAQNAGVFPAPPAHRHDAMIILAADGEALESAAAEVTNSFGAVAGITWEAGYINKIWDPVTEKSVVRDHFGFEEGISQPAFFDVQTKGFPAPVQWAPKNRLSLVLTGQPGAPSPEYGSFLAYVKFQIDVAGFEALVMQAAQQIPGTAPEDFKAWIMGRRLDSEPLAARGTSQNDFTYQADKTFAQCPGGAHIRKMNPRSPEKSQNRILRRSALYGAGEEPKGMLFQCFQSSLRDGFEMLFKGWAKQADSPESGGGMDGVLRSRDLPPTPAGVQFPPGAQVSIQSFTEVKDGEYFYFPSIPFFARAAAS